MTERAWITGLCALGLTTGCGDSTGPGSGGPIALVLGGRHGCRIADGSTQCWGTGDAGQLGLVELPAGPQGPATIDGAPAGGFVALTAGRDHTCGLTAAGAAWCWGAGESGQLGTGTPPTERCGLTPCMHVPAAVSGSHVFRVPAAEGRIFAAISAGLSHVCALTTDGTAWCWGIDVLPLLNAGDLKYYVPNPVNTSLKFETIESARVSECGLTAAGDPYCWGVNGAGEVGTTPIGSTFRFDTPVAVGGGVEFSQIWGETATYCGNSTSGGVYCWGQGTRGELGAGATNSIVPLRVPGT